MKTPDTQTESSARAFQVLNTIRDPVILLDADNLIRFANLEAEYFFLSSSTHLEGRRIDDFLPFSSPLIALIGQVREDGSPVNEYRVDLSSPRIGSERIVDIHVTPVPEEAGAMVIVFRERSMADKFDRQMTHRGAARSVTGLAAMLGHEIKNPLSGIRGAAQLLEVSASDEDRALTQLIRAETDRIVQLVDKMEVFSDETPVDRQAVNIHIVLDRVEKIGKTGFARDVRFTQQYDPSLPFVAGDKDQLIQVFLNLVKNAAESCAPVDPVFTCRSRAPTTGSRYHLSSRSRTMAPAFPRISRCTCSIRSSRPSRTARAWVWRLSPRSLVTMAV